MGQRHAGRRRSPLRGRDPRGDLDRDALGAQGLRLLGTAPEYEGIATLQPDHVPACQRQLDQQVVDPVLRQQ